MKQVIVCLHDVTPFHADRIHAITAELDRRDLCGRYSFLVVPNFHAVAPLDEHANFGEWLRDRRDSGVEMLLHGFFHHDQTDHVRVADRLKSVTMTNREGEFLGLDAEESLRLIERGCEIMENVIGSRPTGFVAPAYLYSEGARTALARAGFTRAEDQFQIWNPATGVGRTLAPVLQYASRRPRSSILASRVAVPALWPVRVARFGIHPHDWDVPVLRTEVLRALDALLKYRRPTQYADVDL